MKCETCDTGRAETILNWTSKAGTTLAAVCDCCAANIWSRIPTGTETYASFTCRPYEKSTYRALREELGAHV